MKPIINYRYINKKRTTKNITIKEISQLWNMAESTVYGVLSGTRKFDVINLKLLLDLLEIEFNDIFKKCPITEHECRKKKSCDCLLLIE